LYVPVIFFLFFISSIIVLFSFSKTTSSRLLSFNDTLPNMYSLFSDIVSILISIGSISIYLSFFLSFNIIVYFLASSILIFFIEITPSSFSLPVIKSSNLIFSPVTSLIKSILLSFSSITSMSKIISFNACSFLASFFINFILKVPLISSIFSFVTFIFIKLLFIVISALLLLKTSSSFNWYFPSFITTLILNSISPLALYPSGGVISFNITLYSCSSFGSSISSIFIFPFSSVFSVLSNIFFSLFFIIISNSVFSKFFDVFLSILFILIFIFSLPGSTF